MCFMFFFFYVCFMCGSEACLCGVSYRRCFSLALKAPTFLKEALLRHFHRCEQFSGFWVSENDGVVNLWRLLSKPGTVWAMTGTEASEGLGPSLTPKSLRRLFRGSSKSGASYQGVSVFFCLMCFFVVGGDLVEIYTKP